VPVSEFGGGSTDGIAFLVSAGIVYEIIAAAASSPQTTEINAPARAGTLMKWVHLGIAQAALFVAAAAFFDNRHRGAIILGGLLAGGILEISYLYAKDRGLRSGGPSTESYA
jgi:hypothetical protein